MDYVATCEAVPGALQAIWGHHRDGLYTFGLDVAEMPPCRPDDLRLHALFGACKAADARHLPRPQVVTTTRVMTMTDPVETLTAQAQWADKLTDHHAAAIVRFPIEMATEMVSHLCGHWSEFVGAEFIPSRG